jgi:hypothetical protein
VTAERSEAAAGQHDNLLVLAGPAQRIEHPLNAVVAAIHQGVIEDDRSERDLTICIFTILDSLPS